MLFNPPLANIEAKEYVTLSLTVSTVVKRITPIKIPKRDLRELKRFLRFYS